VREILRLAEERLTFQAGLSSMESVGRSVGRSVGWLVGWLVSRSVCLFVSFFLSWFGWLVDRSVG